MYLAAFCHLVGATLSTRCPPSLTPHPQSCLCQQGGHLPGAALQGACAHVAPFPCLAASLSNSIPAWKARTPEAPWIVCLSGASIS